MTNDLQAPVPEAQPESPPMANNPVSQPSKGLDRNIWIIFGVGAAVSCLCIFLCVALGATSLWKVMAERAPVEAVLDSYMRHMANGDVESAYALFSPRAQRQIPIAEVQEMLEGNNYIIFEGYQYLSVQNININVGANTNPDVPQGTVATVAGTITYEGGFQGTFNGILEKVDGQWMIDGMHVTVPPNKFEQ